jgi:hypothetical protein
MGFFAKPPAAIADSWLETASNRYALLRIQFGRNVQLVWQKTPRELLIAPAHHDRAAVAALVLTHQLVRIYASAREMRTVLIHSS